MTVDELVAWATDYYPAKDVPPPEPMQLTDAEIAEVMARIPHRQAQLALVDQAWFREAVPAMLAKATWDKLEYTR
jgi:hypothetical protein